MPDYSGLVGGFIVHEPVVVATCSPLDGVFNFESPVGFSNSDDRLVIDGVHLTYGHRLIVKDQPNVLENGVYEVIEDGMIGWVITRVSDFNYSVDGGIYRVLSGSVNGCRSMVYLSPGDFQFYSGVDEVLSLNNESWLDKARVVREIKVELDTNDRYRNISDFDKSKLIDKLSSVLNSN